MRTIGNLATEKAASQFSDFLYVRGIENQFEPEDDGTFSLWILNEEHVKPAAELFAKFRSNPNAPEFSPVTGAAEKVRQAELRAEASRRSTVADTARIGYEQTLQVTPYFTYLLMVISVAVAVYSQLGMDKKSIQSLFIAGFEVSESQVRLLPGLPEVRSGQIWRLITPIFIHFNLMHIVFNMMLLKDLGTFTETRFSARYMAVLVLVSAALSNYGQYLWSRVPFGGMSGVDYALFGFLWIRGHFDQSANWQLNKNTVYAMVGWFFLCLTGLLGPIANGAHGVGLAAGMSWGFLSSKRLFSR